MKEKRSGWVLGLLAVLVTSMVFSLGCKKFQGSTDQLEAPPSKWPPKPIGTVSKSPPTAAQSLPPVIMPPLVRKTEPVEEVPVVVVPEVQETKTALVSPPPPPPPAPVENLAVANPSPASRQAVAGDDIDTSEPVLFANKHVAYADLNVGSLAGEIKALMAMVSNVSAAVAGKTDVVERVVEKPVDRVVEKPMTTEAMIKKLNDKLENDITDNRSGLRPYLAKASLCLMHSDCLLREEDMAKLNAEDRSIVEDYRVMFTQLGQRLGQGDQSQDREALSAAALALTETLGERKPLRLAQAVLCGRISGFGLYEPFMTNEFRRGSLQQILLYTELANFKSSLQSDGQTVVKVVQELSLYRAGSGSAECVWAEQPARATDLSRTKRSDFFLQQLLRLPKTLAPGDYELRVKVTDLTTSSSAQAGIPLRVLEE